MSVAGGGAGPSPVRAAILPTRSGCSAAPPPPRPWRVEVLPPPNPGATAARGSWWAHPRSSLATPSRSISSRARSGVPLVGQYDFGAGDRGRVQQAVAGGDVEQGSGCHEDRLRRRSGSGFGAGLTSPAAIALALAEGAVVAPMVMMLKMLSTDPRWVSCAPFGKPGGAGRVEDGGVVVRVDFGVGHLGELRIVAGHLRRPSVIAPSASPRSLRTAMMCIGASALGMSQHALEALVVGNEHLRLSSR